LLYGESVVDNKLILITLLVKLGIAASVASALTRSRAFQNALFSERRTLRCTMIMMGCILVPLTLGVWARTIVPNFLAADIAFETTILLGLLLGPFWAICGGACLAIPALLHHEYLSLPFNMFIGLVFGLLGGFVEADEVWSFSPFIDLSLYRWVRRTLRQPRIDRQILMLTLIVAAGITREWLAHLYPLRIFALNSDSWGILVLIWLSAPMVVGIVLKVWNALRIELKLEEQKRLLLEARLDALQRQINPHFLFNTLNSISSLVRIRPEMAREMTVKLASILRALLRDHDVFVPLSEELKFTDDYLDIEVVRFGSKLKVVKDIDPRTLETPVPSILLQPLIENGIKHGLEPRIEGGTITLRTTLEHDLVRIEISDDGVGMGGRPKIGLRRPGSGIGMKNVRERLDMLFGTRASFDVHSSPGRGTRITILLPAPIQRSE